MQSGHACMIYGGSSDRHLPSIAAVMREKLGLGHRCMYFNSPEMISELQWQLTSLGVDVQLELEAGRVVLTSERPHLRDGLFNMEMMLQTLEEAFHGAINNGYAGLWTSGDMGWEFGPGQDFSKLREYELRLHEFFSKHPEYSGICQYHGPSLPSQVLNDALQTHPTIFLSKTMSIPNLLYRDA